MSEVATRAYLVDEHKRKASAHIWSGSDTACRMWSTGGMNRAKPSWLVRGDADGRLVCHMCLLAVGDAAEASPCFQEASM